MNIVETNGHIEDFPRPLVGEAILDTSDALDDVGISSPLTRRQLFESAQQSAKEGSAVDLTVRELISYWGAKSRGRSISRRIVADLKRHELLTHPDFRKVGLDSQVSLVTHPVDELVVEGSTVSTLKDILDKVVLDEVGITLGNLQSAMSGVERIKPQASIDEAITRMLLNAYSQVAVMSGPRTLLGAVTWQSIARGRHANHDATLADATVTAEVRSFDTELIDVLQTLQEKDFVFVKDETNLISGIVTTADVVASYGQLATPFFLIGELDQLLRRVISNHFPLGEVMTFLDKEGTRGIHAYDDLSFGDYERFLEHRENWATLNWPLDRPCFIARLTNLREVRNDIMHFNPDPTPEGVVDNIRNMIRLLKEYV